MQRVVTTYGADGRPSVLFRGEPTMIDRQGKYVTRELWVSDETPARLSVGSDTALAGYALEPAPAGTRFRIVEIMPCTPRQMAAAAEEGPDVSGEHRTDTLDYVVVLRGEVTLVVGDDEVTLRAGDAVVQQGVEHDWVNRGSEPCVMAAVLVGGVR